MGILTFHSYFSLVRLSQALHIYLSWLFFHKIIPVSSWQKAWGTYRRIHQQMRLSLYKPQKLQRGCKAHLASQTWHDWHAAWPSLCQMTWRNITNRPDPTLACLHQNNWVISADDVSDWLGEWYAGKPFRRTEKKHKAIDQRLLCSLCECLILGRLVWGGKTDVCHNCVCG